LNGIATRGTHRDRPVNVDAELLQNSFEQEFF
jgi:hypothetical protein